MFVDTTNRKNSQDISLQKLFDLPIWVFKLMSIMQQRKKSHK